MSDERKFRIDLSLTDEWGCTHSMSDEYIYFDEFEDVSEVGRILTYINIWLKQCGYFRDNDYMFEKDLTLDEIGYLEQCLDEYRESKKEKKI